MPRGVRRFESSSFGVAEAAAIVEMIADGRRSDADDELRHLVHIGVRPTELFEAAMALARQES